MNASLEVLESMFTTFGGWVHSSHPMSAQYLVFSLRHGVLFTRRLFLKPRLGRLPKGGFNRYVKIRGSTPHSFRKPTLMHFYFHAKY